MTPKKREKKKKRGFAPKELREKEENDIPSPYSVPPGNTSPIEEGVKSKKAVEGQHRTKERVYLDQNFVN